MLSDIEYLHACYYTSYTPPFFLRPNRSLNPQRRTEGLFGYWDRWDDNDLQVPKIHTSSGDGIVTTRDPESLFKQFGIYWRIQDQRASVLTRPIGRNFSWIHLTYNLREFFPIFGLPPLPKWTTDNPSFTGL